PRRAAPGSRRAPPATRRERRGEASRSGLAHRPVDLGVFLRLDADLLGLLTELALPDLDVVVPGRDVGDLEVPVRVRHRKVRRVHRHPPRVHPGMRVALHPDGPLRLLDLPFDLLLELRLRAVGLGVLLPHHVHIVEDAVRVQDLDRAAGREREHVRYVLASLLIEGDGLRRHLEGLPLRRLHDHHDITDAAAGAHDEVVLRLALAAHLVVLRDVELLRRRRGALELHGARERAAVGDGGGLVGHQLGGTNPRADQHGEPETGDQNAAPHRGSSFGLSGSWTVGRYYCVGLGAAATTSAGWTAAWGAGAVAVPSAGLAAGAAGVSGSPSEIT